jgi:urease accessory protein
MPAPSMPPAMLMTTPADAVPSGVAGGNPVLYRLLAWLSPGFPIGAFSYSHGLETAVADGAVCDLASLERWIAAIVAHGSGRIDADILRDAHRAAAADHLAALAHAQCRGAAFRATAELALESAQQGAAFLAAYEAAWQDPHPNPPPPAGEGTRELLHPPPLAGEGGVGVHPGTAHGRDGACHPAVFGAAAARAGVALADALLGYLQAFAANLVSAGLRLGIVGQSDGQRILARLEPIVAAAAEAAINRDAADFGAATFAADLASMAHETLYTRLFRS